jgi:hypothetical protein
MPAILITASFLSPRIGNLHDFVAGLIAIRSHGIVQNIHLHPADKAAVEDALAAASSPKRKPCEVLHSKGYSLRTAACALKVDHGHVRRVLTGERTSRRLLRAIEALPSR